MEWKHQTYVDPEAQLTRLISEAYEKAMDEISETVTEIRQCHGNCHKPIEQGGAAPCSCDCCRVYTR